MNNNNYNSIRSAIPRWLLLGLLPAVVLLLSNQASQAGSATWKASPASGDWNTATNWMPQTIPNGPSDTATFATSNTTGVSLSAITEVNGIVFNAGASAFTIISAPLSQGTVQLTISGVGITNNSGITQNFVASVPGRLFLQFTNSASAGSFTSFTTVGGPAGGIGSVIDFLNNSTADNGSFTNKGGNHRLTGEGGAGGGQTNFGDSSTAGDGTFSNKGGRRDGAGGGSTNFSGTSSAGNATFTNHSGKGGGSGGQTTFGQSATAGNATITNDGGLFSIEGAVGGGLTRFFNTSTADDATLIANSGIGGGDGGTIRFFHDSTGGTARMEMFGNGNLDITAHNAPGVTTGSIEGNGNVFLGARNLTVGSNNLSTAFSGVIQDGEGATGGSLTKTGRSKLNLTNANTFTGGSTIEGGKLLVNNKSGSGTGSGAVQVNAGTLGGTGVIAGAATIGDGSGPRAILSPGFTSDVDPGTLTIQSALTFNSDATYNFLLNTNTAKADQVVAAGVTINSGAQFSFTDFGSNTLTPGTVFTVIDNTSANPIAGIFSNLPDGLMFASNGNNFQASYTGGNGNDLTLTVRTVGTRRKIAGQPLGSSHHNMYGPIDQQLLATVGSG